MSRLALDVADANLAADPAVDSGLDALGEILAVEPNPEDHSDRGQQGCQDERDDNATPKPAFPEFLP